MSVVAGPTSPFPARATLADLVVGQAAERPDAVAVIHEDRQLSYGELHARAARLAHHLGDRGVGPDVPVAICLERSIALTVGLLGVLEAGGACMPLDPSYPPKRLATMLDDAAAPVLLTERKLAGRLPAYRGQIVYLDADWTEIARNPATPPAVEAGPDHLAYVIYTSGSTGEPKGVMLTHRGLVNHSMTVSDLYELAPDDRVVQFCSIGFDVSVEELFPTWATGATVVLRSDDVPILGREWLRWLGRARITVLNLPTAYWHRWVGDLQALAEQPPACIRLVVVGGEKPLGTAYRTWLEVGGDRVRWLNAYGPAEASVTATVFEPPRDRPWPVDRDPPIGRPVANTTVRILDDCGEHVPVGVVGDLHLGGVGVARGYLRRPELTADRFVSDPDRPGERLYRTGDLVRMLDGNLEFVGRADEQVKIRGFRVECHEVESVLSRHAGVAQVAVRAREDEPGSRRLVAYVVAASGVVPTSVELRRFLRERLPSFMVPSSFVRLDALPITPTEKVDREALPPPGDPRHDLPTDWMAPGTAAEETIAAIWSQALGIDAIGVNDDFFELGGNSLQAIQVIAEVSQAFDVKLGVRAFFAARTVALLAALVEPLPGDRGGRPPLARQPRRPGMRIPLTLSQEHMWALEGTADPPGLFNVTAQHRFPGAVDESALRSALAHVVERHEPLRTSFHTRAGTPYQSVAPTVTVELAVCDLSAVAVEERDSELHRQVAEQDAQPFDLARRPLFRPRLYRLAEDRSMVAVTFDHLVCDGTSAYVFLADLVAAYEALANGRQPRLHPLAARYSDFALWQRSWLTEERLEPQLQYWKRKLAGMPLGPAVPFDGIPEKPTRRIASRPVSVTGDTYKGLRRLSRTTGSTVFIVTVAAVQALFSCVGGLTDIVLSTTLSGRQLPQLEGLVGCFHGIGRIRNDLSGDPSFETVVARTRNTVLGLFENQDIPFMRVRQAVLPDLPKGGPALLGAVPIEFQYFHTAHDEWTPGAGVVERPGPDKGPDELFFRGQLHPLNVTFLDDGERLWGELRYKVDFYDEETSERLVEGLARLLTAVTRDPRLRLSELPVAADGRAHSAS